MTAQPDRPGFGPDSALNTELVCRLPRGVGVELSGSLYAVAPAHRLAAAQLLTEQNIWIHADVFEDAQTGVSLDLIRQLSDEGAGPLDVHLLTAGTLQDLDAVCRPGISRITFPFEDVPDPAAVAARIRAAGISPWLAVAPTTTLETCTGALPHVDGLLVMLIEPGTRDSFDPAQLGKVSQASTARSVGVDGGVGEDNLGKVLNAGATYIVVGRRLFAVPTPSGTTPSGTTPSSKETP